MAAGAALIGALFATSVAAEVVSIQVTGTVENLYDPDNALGGQVQVGQTVTGVYSYDTDVPDQDPTPEYGRYEQDPGQVSVSFDIGTFTFASAASAQSSSIFAVDVGNSDWGDWFHVSSLMNNLPLSNGSSVDYIDIDLYDPSATAFSSDALPEAPPGLTSFEHHGIHFSGQSSSGHPYDFEVRIDSQQLASDTQLPPGTFEIVAQIGSVYDPGFALGGALQPGMQITGSYRVDLGTPDSEPSPEIGHYEHPMTAGWGFSLSAGGYTFQSNSAAGPVFVDVINGSSDGMHVITNSGTVEPGSMTTYYIDMHLMDPTGTAFSSDALSPEAPNLAMFGDERRLMIGGVDQSGQYWYVDAEVVSITAAASGVSDPVVVTPASGFFVAPQIVEVAFLMPAGKVPGVVTGTVNGAPVPGWFTDSCWPEYLPESGREVLRCQDIHPLLQNGSNNVTWTVNFNDGTSVTESVEWRLFK